MSLQQVRTDSRYPRKAYRLQCDGCFLVANTGLTVASAYHHAEEAGFMCVEASDRPEGYWICPDCFKRWNPALRIQEFVKGG